MANYTDAFEGGVLDQPLTTPWASANSLPLKYISGGSIVSGNGSSATASCYYDAPTADAHYSYVVHVGDGSSGSSGSGVAVRMQSGVDSYYYAHFGFGQHMYIGQQIAGSGTDWEDITAAGDLPTAGQEWGLRVSGTTVEYVVAGVVKKTYTGKNALSGGKAGVIAYSESAGPTASNLASWAGGDLATGVVGDALITVAGISLSADASVTGSVIVADAAINIPVPTIAAAGSLSINADASIVLGALSLSSTLDAGWTITTAWDDLTGEDGYRVKWGTASNTYDHTSPDLPANTTTYGIPNLSAGVTYYSRVYGLVSGVEQDPSAEISFTVGTVQADGSISLGTVTLTSDATVTQASGNTANVDISLPVPILTATGSVEIVATATITLPVVVLSADGTVSSAGGPVTADGSIVLDTLYLTGTALVTQAPVIIPGALPFQLWRLFRKGRHR